VTRAATVSSSSHQHQDQEQFIFKKHANLFAGFVGTVAASSTFYFNSGCEKNQWAPADLPKEDLAAVTQDEDEDEELDNFPVFTSDQVAEHDGTDGKPVWMSYGGVVYDVTNFISNHPGGSQKIMNAAGSVSKKLHFQ
jgi:cytochrome b involved in lipid metabolism